MGEAEAPVHGRALQFAAASLQRVHDDSYAVSGHVEPPEVLLDPGRLRGRRRKARVSAATTHAPAARTLTWLRTARRSTLVTAVKTVTATSDCRVRHQGSRDVGVPARDGARTSFVARKREAAAPSSPSWRAESCRAR